ncbi:MAG: 2-oxo acid dehydrogenase subunit E2 [Actinomycetota bacterium]|nr:2-oxo acid dehydrogenase subunit E2 [Actinomycetota bacterium]
MPDFRLPDLGEGVTEAEVERWLVKEGDDVKEDDPLVEVITDKATAEIPSPYEGAVSRIHVGEGEVVAVGTVLVTIGETAGAEKPSPQRRERVKAMPPVRRLARDLGVDLGSITPTGSKGDVTRSDVELAAAPVSDERGGRAEPGRTGRREPLRGVRRTISERMTTAHREIPAVTHVEECDVTELDITRKLLTARHAQEAKLTYLPFVVKAAIMGLRRFPALNASLDESAQEIIFHDRFDIGIAVDTDAGLSVPVVKDADAKSMFELAREIERLAKGAREGTLERDDLRDGTFTVTSPGPFGGLMATPIILHPQSAILGVHRAAERPVVRDGQVVIRKVMNLSVSFDHRILDGLTAAKFALEVTTALEHPALLGLL